MAIRQTKIGLLKSLGNGLEFPSTFHFFKMIVRFPDRNSGDAVLVSRVSLCKTRIVLSTTILSSPIADKIEAL